MTHENSPQDLEMQIAAGKRLLKRVLVILGILLFIYYIYGFISLVEKINHAPELHKFNHYKQSFIITNLLISFLFIIPIFMSFAIYKNNKISKKLLLLLLIIITTLFAFAIQKGIQPMARIFLTFGIIIYLSYFYFIFINKKIQNYYKCLNKLENIKILEHISEIGNI